MSGTIKMISCNVNGLRAFVGHGGTAVLEKYHPDIVCLQETKLSCNSTGILRHIFPEEYDIRYSLSEEGGRSGVCVASRIPILEAEYDIGFEKFDRQGRFLSVKLENGLRIMSLYMPHGKRDKSDIPYKLQAFDYIEAYLKHVSQGIVCTDFNVAHRETDLARPAENRNNTMFTEAERSLVDRMEISGFIDAFREKHSEGGQYTWWPYSFHAYERNLGWRIDYFFVQRSLEKRIRQTEILHQERYSDHCPIFLELMN